jgi:UDP-N-acetylmuramate--alanine ligase
MEGLAQVLVQGGLFVSASEPSGGPAVARMRQLGVRVHTGHSPRSYLGKARWLVCDAGTSQVDPHRLSARRRGLDVRTPAECLAALLRRGIGLALAGGRDASMAAAMIGWTLTRCGRDPTVVLASASAQLGGWARFGRGPHVVVDALIGGPSTDWGTLAPRLAVMLDNPIDCGVDGETDAWQGFVDSYPEASPMLARAGSRLAARALRGPAGSVEWLALERGFDWWGADLREERGRLRFRSFCKGRYVTELRLQVPGRRNVLCALAAVAACSRLGVPAAEIRQALEEFTGVSRNFESRGSYRGVTLVDDAGSNPAAVGEALGLARQVFGDRRLWAVLTASAGGIDPEAQGRFAGVLALADFVVLVAKDSSDRLAQEVRALEAKLAAAGVWARSVANLDAAVLELDRHLEPGDVLVTLGTGDVGTISDAFIRRLSRDRPD